MGRYTHGLYTGHNVSFACVFGGEEEEEGACVETTPL